MFQLFAGIGGCAALVVAGAIQRQVQVNSYRLDNIERGGSPGLMAHVQKDQAEQQEQDRRLLEGEKDRAAFNVAVGDLRVQLGTMNAKLDSLKEQVAVLTAKTAVKAPNP